MCSKQKANPRRGLDSPGVLLCLTALVVTVKPLAYVVADYTCSDRHNEGCEGFHVFHPLPVASMGKGSKHNIPYFDNCRKVVGKKPTPFAKGAGFSCF